MLEKEKNSAISIPLKHLTLKANLYIPENAKGLVSYFPTVVVAVGLAPEIISLPTYLIKRDWLPYCSTY
jgi:hypothetical protein